MVWFLSVLALCVVLLVDMLVCLPRRVGTNTSACCCCGWLKLNLLHTTNLSTEKLLIASSHNDSHIKPTHNVPGAYYVVPFSYLSLA